MKQRYNDPTHGLFVHAVLDCFDGKWARNDVIQLVNEYAGISRAEILREQYDGSYVAKLEAVENIAFEMERRLNDLLNGNPDALDLDPVSFRPRKDGMTGKVRNIAYCCMMHQLFNHLVYLGLEPLFKVRIMPQQFASIPGKGQTGLAKTVHGYFANPKLDIRHGEKTDVSNAYGSTEYAVAIDLIEREIPSAKWIFALLRALARMSPNGCLIIGGYIDAWLFNFLMGYAIRFALNLGKTRRGKFIPLVKRIVTFMDDFAFMGTRLADVKSVIKKTVDYMCNRFGLKVKVGKTTSLLSNAEERQRRHKASPAARGSPELDMGGYVMHRRYITIRKAIFLRLRRQYLRAWDGLRKTGYILLVRAKKIVAYNGYFKPTNSHKIKKTLKPDEMLTYAKACVAYAARKKERGKRLCTA